MRTIVLIQFLIIYISVFSQSTDSSFVKQNKIHYSFSYFGYNLIKPGLNINISYKLTSKNSKNIITKKSGRIKDKSTTQQFILGGNIGFLWYPHSHSAVFNFYQIVYKKIKPAKNKFSTIGIGPGVYRSIYPETYEITDNNEVRKIYFAGETYFAPVLSFGGGKNLQNKVLKSRFINTNLMFLFNYNTGVVPLLIIEIGFKIK